jgi:hypothetical protein
MRALVIIAATLAVGLGTAGCSAAKDKADSAAAAAKSKAAAEVKSQVQDQICDLVQDKQLSDADRQKLSSLVEQAKKVKVPDSVLEPAQSLLSKSGGSSAKTEINELRQRCGLG